MASGVPIFWELPLECSWFPSDDDVFYPVSGYTHMWSGLVVEFELSGHIILMML